jgi:type IV fimbrial biogenesis protein FimT
MASAARLDGARPTRRAARGFTIIELMVTIALLVLLIGLAVPAFMSWIRNTQIRTVAEALQNGLRQARTESLRLNRSVVFYLTNGNPSPAAIVPAAANGTNWAIARMPQFDDPTTPLFMYVAGGKLTDVASSVTITSATTSLCFSANGRISDNAIAGTAVTGAVCTAGAKQFDITKSPSSTDDRPMRVLLAIGGQVHMCDPNRPTLSATSPDGCP